MNREEKKNKIEREAEGRKREKNYFLRLILLVSNLTKYECIFY